jgi:hypothetical protein
MQEQRSKSQGDITFAINGQSYRAHLLGGDAVGSTSFIYLARRWNSQSGQVDGPPLILKRFQAEEKLVYERERDVLLKMQAHTDQDGERYIPQLFGYSEQHLGGAPSFLLLMEYAGNQPVDSRVPLDEPEALLLIGHYLACLIGLVSVGYTCWDRKLKDLFWTAPDPLDNPTGRLLVVDWNMAEDWDVERMRNDLSQAGRLSYEALTGMPALLRAGSVSYDLERSTLTSQSPVTHNHVFKNWGQISFGAQRIVEDLLAGSRQLAADAQAAAAPKDYCIHWIERIRGRCTEIIDLWRRDVTPLMDQARIFLQAEQPESALQCSSIAVLKENHDGSEWSQGQLRLPQHREIHERAQQAVAEKRNPLAATQQYLRDGQIAQAETALAQLRAGGMNLMLEQELSVMRWSILTRAGRTVWDTSNASRLVQDLKTLEDALRKGNFDEAAKVGAQLTPISQVFQDEIAVRKNFRQSEEESLRNRYDQARDRYVEAVTLLNAQPNQPEDVRRFWELIRESLGDIEQRAKVVEQKVEMLGAPDQALADAIDCIKAEKFGNAIQRLEEGLNANPTRVDLKELRTVANQLAYLKRMGGQFRLGDELDNPLVVGLTWYAQELCRQPEPLYADYSNRVHEAVRKACRVTTELLLSTHLPATRSEAQVLLRRGEMLADVLAELRAQGVDSLDGTAPLPEDGSIMNGLERLRKHIEDRDLLDQLIDTPKANLSLRQRLLMIAERLGIQILARGANVRVELDQINQTLRQSDEGHFEAHLNAIVQSVRDWLPQQTSRDTAQSVLREIESDLKRLLDQAPLLVATSFQGWLADASVTLPKALDELNRIQQEYEQLPRTPEARLRPLIKQLDQRSGQALSAIRDLQQLWPANLGASPELAANLVSKPDQTAIKQLWHERFTALSKHLAHLAAGGTDSRHITKFNLILIGLEECQAELGDIKADVSEQLASAQQLLDQALDQHFERQHIPFDGQLRKEMKEFLLEQAGQLAERKATLPALWTVGAAIALGETGDEEDQAAGKRREEIVDEISRQAQPDVQGALIQLFKDPSYQKGLMTPIIQDLNVQLPQMIRQGINTSNISNDIIAKFDQALRNGNVDDYIIGLIQKYPPGQTPSFVPKLEEVARILMQSTAFYTLVQQKVGEITQHNDTQRKNDLTQWIKSVADQTKLLTREDAIELLHLLTDAQPNSLSAHAKALSWHVQLFGIYDAQTGKRDRWLYDLLKAQLRRVAGAER